MVGQHGDAVRRSQLYQVVSNKFNLTAKFEPGFISIHLMILSIELGLIFDSNSG